MRQNRFGELPPASALTLGGGGLGMVWGETTFDECVATVHAAVAAGINWIDLAPRYGEGKAELVVGEAFGGRLPEGVRVTSKCNLGNPSSAEIEPLASAIDRRKPRTPATIAARSVLLAFECRPGHGPHGAPARCRQPHDPLRNLCRPSASAFRAAGRRGGDRGVGSDRHRSSRHDHQTARGTPGPGGSPVHRQFARFSGWT